MLPPPGPRPNIIAQEGPIAQGCASWLWYKHDQLLVAIVECGGRAKSGRILQIAKFETGETIIVIMTAENYSWQALIHLPLHPNMSSLDRASRHSSCSVLFCDLYYINLRQQTQLAFPLFAERLYVCVSGGNTINICVGLLILPCPLHIV